MQAVENDPFIPEKFGKPIKGMGAKEYWPTNSIEHARLSFAWQEHLLHTRILVRKYAEIANKEDLNRLLEPFMYHTALITATEFDNFFKLRTNSAADWKIKRIADLMYEAYYECEQPEGNSNIQKLKVGEWHCPLVSLEDYAAINALLMFDNNYIRTIEQKGIEEIQQEIVKKISVARCARVSYLTHAGKRDIEKDLELFERLRTSGHYSPFEHVATPAICDPNKISNATSQRAYCDDNGNIKCANFWG